MGAALGVLVLSGCEAGGAREPDAEPPRVDAARTPDDPPDPAGTLTLAFAGDIHFEGGLTALPEWERATLGPMSSSLREADLAVVNLEAALTERGAPTRKELEAPGSRYWFRSPASTLDLLGRSGADVVSVANNHGADYGPPGCATPSGSPRTPRWPSSGPG